MVLAVLDQLLIPRGHQQHQLEWAEDMLAAVEDLTLIKAVALMEAQVMEVEVEDLHLELPILEVAVELIEILVLQDLVVLD